MNKEKILRLDLFFAGIIEIFITTLLVQSEIISYANGVVFVIGGIGLIYASSISKKVLRYE